MRERGRRKGTQAVDEASVASHNERRNSLVRDPIRATYIHFSFLDFVRGQKRNHARVATSAHGPGGHLRFRP
jgi:hypothetical protein